MKGLKSYGIFDFEVKQVRGKNRENGDFDWKSVYEAYPVNEELIWLNNCGTTPAGRHAVQAVKRFLDGYSKRGVLTEAARYKDVRANIKGILASLLHCRPEDLALVHNTAEGMNFISHGQKLNPGDEIILLENEYPSNVYPWLHWKRKGIRILTVPMARSPEGFLEKLYDRISSKTRLISLSAVHWCTGMPLPLGAVGELCKDRKITFVVDGAQGVGMQPLDAQGLGIDYMAFSGWKWLMGPLGLGVLYVSEKGLDGLDPIFIGTESVENDEQFLPYRTTLKPSADRFTFSTPNFTDWVYFEASLQFLRGIGFEKVRCRILELTATLNQGLRKIGFKVFSDHFPSHLTGITVCENPRSSARELTSFLRDHGVVAAERLGRVRLSPHIYISPHQLERTVDLLSHLQQA